MITETSNDIRDLPSDPTPPMLIVSELTGEVWMRLKPENDPMKLRLGQILPEGAIIAVGTKGSCTLAVARRCLQVSEDAKKVKLESNFPECLHLVTNCCDVKVKRYELMTSAGTVNVSSAVEESQTASPTSASV